MSDDTDTLFEFPCQFPIKIMGESVPEFESRILEIVRSHAPDVSEDAVSTRPSSNGRYTAITVVIEAHSRAQLDSIYYDLTACELVSVAL